MIAAALGLFARRGYERTTVGDIEAAAGFAARGGTLYKHFPSKEALLDAVLDRHLREVETSRRIVDLLPLGDLRAETTLVFRYLFAELARYRDVTALIEKEGDGAPQLGRRFWTGIAEPGYRLTADLLERQLNVDGPGGWDTEALAVLLVGAVVNVRRSEWTFDETPLGVGEERIVQAVAALVERLSVPPDP